MNVATIMLWPATALAFGIDLAAKTTVILLIVLAIQNVLGRLRPSLGSAAANAGLIGLLLLPFLTLALPSLAIPCLPKGVFAETGKQAQSAFVPAASARLGQLAQGSLPIVPNLNTTPFDVNSETARAPQAGEARPAQHIAVLPALFATAAAGDGGSIARVPIRKTVPAAIVVATYVLIALVFLTRICTSVAAVSRLRSSCREVDDIEWTDAFARWRRRLGIRPRVALVRSPVVTVPVALGWLRPTIVLPDSLFGSKSRGPIDAVLLHELSHIGRGDYVWNLILRVVQAVYWPHVLVWVLGRAIAEMRERVCDELCVCELGGPAAYREALLAVALGIVRRPGAALGLAMARSSKLVRRLAQIERSAGDPRYLAGRPLMLIFGTLAIAATGVIGAAQLVRAEPRATKSLDLVAAAGQAPIAGNIGRVFNLRVVAAGANEPIPDADVRVSMAFRTEWRKTDAQGRLDIAHSTGPSDQTLNIDLWAKGRAMQRHSWDNNSNRPIPDSATIALQPGEALGGTVQDESGRPISGVTVYLWSHNYRKRDPHELLYDLRATSGSDGKWQTSGAPETTGELLGFRISHPDFLSVRDYRQGNALPKIADLRATKVVTVMKKGVPIEGRVVDADGKPVAGAKVLSADDERAMFLEIEPFAVATDAAGHFRTGQVKPGKWYLTASAQGHAPGDQVVTIGTAVPQVEIALTRPRPFKGRVLDLDGKPVPGAFFDPDVWRNHRSLGAFHWTDPDGRFHWDDAPDDELIVNVNAPGYRGVFQQHVAPSSAEHEFRLAASLTIRGKVINAETKKRVDNAVLEYSAVDPATGESSKWTSPPQIGFGTGIFQGNLDANFPVTASAYKIRVHAAGFNDFVSRVFRREEKLILGYDIALVPGTTAPAGAVATVVGPDGQPLAGARVLEVQAGGQLNLENGAPNLIQANHTREDRTSPEGKFPIPRYDGPCFVAILGDDSFAFTDQETLSKDSTVHAARYGRIDGRVLVGSRIVPDQELELTGTITNRFTRMSNVFVSSKTKSDRNGQFAFEKVLPGRGLRIVRRYPEDWERCIWSIGNPVRVEPGTTSHVVLGGSGRPVIGRVEPPAGWTKPIDFTDASEAHLESDRPFNPIPVGPFRGKRSLRDVDLTAWDQKWRDSPESWEYAERRVSIGAAIAPDGSFQIDDVAPGEYRVAIRINGESRIHVTLTRKRNAGPFLRAIRTFTMPEASRARKDPLDLGVLRLQPRVSLRAGQPAPPFDVTTIDGKKLSIPRDFQGKFLMLDFGTMWDVQSRHQIPPLNDVYEKYGKDPDPRLAVLSFISATDTGETRKFIEEKGEPWPQAIIGPLSNPIASLYGIDDENVSTMTLIGPDGKIVATELWSEKIGEAVAKALAGVDQ
jgi:beta-lactamase regulating signal transducer with metallopeptidase domain